MTATTVIRQHDEGERLWFAGGGVWTMKATAAETGGAFLLIEDRVVRGKSTPLHLHPHEDEAIYVLEGEVTILLGEQTMTASAGAFAFVPRGTVHTFSNQGPKEVRFLVIISPPGFERAFEEMAEVAPSADQPPDMDRLMAIAQKYNLKIAGPPPS